MLLNFFPKSDYDQVRFLMHISPFNLEVMKLRADAVVEVNSVEADAVEDAVVGEDS